MKEHSDQRRRSDRQVRAKRWRVEAIKSTDENPIECLGKWYDDSKRDRKNIANTERQAEKWFRRIETPGLEV